MQLFIGVVFLRCYPSVTLIYHRKLLRCLLFDSNGAVERSRASDLLITKRKWKFRVYINQSLAMFANSKNSIKQPQTVLLVMWFGTKLTQSFLSLLAHQHG